MPHDGAMCDLLWSDPEDGVDGWGLSPRGAGAHCLLAARRGLAAVDGSGEEDGAGAVAVLLCSRGEEGGSV